MSQQACPWANLMEAIPQLRFPLHRCVKWITAVGHHNGARACLLLLDFALQVNLCCYNVPPLSGLNMIYIDVDVYSIFFLYSLCVSQLGCFYILAVENTVVIKHRCTCNSVVHWPESFRKVSEELELCGRSIFSLLKVLPVDFHSDWTNTRSH